ncbi:MAG: arylesterase [Pseudomonadota bacterium]
MVYQSFRPIAKACRLKKLKQNQGLSAVQKFANRAPNQHTLRLILARFKLSSLGLVNSAGLSYIIAMKFLEKLVGYAVFVALLVPIHCPQGIAEETASAAATKSSKVDSKMKPFRFVIIGDSLTDGYGIRREDAYPNQLKILMENEGLKRPLTMVNAGVSGSTSSSLKKRLEWQLKNRPDALMLTLGANDGLRGQDHKMMKSRLKTAIEKAKSSGVEVILAGMQMPLNYGEEYRRKYANAFAEVAKETRVFFIPFLLEGVAADKKYNQEDLIHPNEKGHKKIAEHVWSKLKKQPTFRDLIAGKKRENQKKLEK